MGKHEHPPFRMVIEGGKLVPATAFDAERLDSYRRGTSVRVHFTEEKDRVLVRKWWAILGLVVKQCDVPWQNKEQASEAIKLALGIVNLSKTVSGKFMQYPKSLTELTDPELQEAVDGMLVLIERMTGVDPETLKKEAADVGGDIEHESSAPSPAEDADGAEQSETGDDPAASSAPSDTSPDDHRDLLLRIYRAMADCVGPSVEDFNRAFKIFDADLKDAPAPVRRKAATIRVSLEFCCGEKPKRTKLQARSYLAGIIGVGEEELSDG